MQNLHDKKFISNTKFPPVVIKLLVLKLCEFSFHMNFTNIVSEKNNKSKKFYPSMGLTYCKKMEHKQYLKFCLKKLRMVWFCFSGNI